MRERISPFIQTGETQRPEATTPQEIVIFPTPKNPEEQMLRPEQADEFAEFYSDFREKILRFHLSRVRNADLAEDLTQDTFLKVMTHWNGFDNRSKRTSWLYPIAKNTITDHFRVKKNATSLEEDFENVLFIKDPDPTPEDIAMQRSTGDSLVEALGALIPTERTAVSLRFVKDLSGLEIAELMNISHLAERAVQSRGIKKLRNDTQLAQAVGY